MIRRDLATFFVNAWNRAEDDHRADVDRRMALKEPMASVTGAPATAAPTPTPAPSTPTPAPSMPTPAPATPETTAELIARSEAVLRKSDAVLKKTAPTPGGAGPAPDLRPYDPSGPSRQAPYDPSKGPAAPTPAPDQPVSTPLPPTASILHHAPKAPVSDDTVRDPVEGFGFGTGEHFEDFSR